MLSGRADLPVAPVWCPGGGWEQADSPLAPSNGALLYFCAAAKSLQSAGHFLSLWVTPA